MSAMLNDFMLRFGLTTEMLVMAGIGLGALVAFFGIWSTLAGRDPVLVRLEAQRARGSLARDAGILRDVSGEPSGFLKSLVPKDEKELSLIRRELAAAGLSGPHAVRDFTLFRVLAGIVLPLVFTGVVLAGQQGMITLPPALLDRVNGLSRQSLQIIVALMVAIGFFGPSWWLRGRVNARRQRLSDAFPNALDLIQISVEAGMGFDAAMVRIGNELSTTAPDLAQEFLSAQREIQAGRQRDRALIDMADRTGLDEVRSFVNVVLQSIQFGTPIAGTLSVYAREMRVARELRAQEMANKLPVKLSATMASLMLPALVMLTIGPVAIRYMRYFSE
jgi:tight adherence protein C